MTQSIAGRSGGGPTRQQLDELDALLQRMLDLPVSQGQDEEPAPPPRPARPSQAAEPELPQVRYYEPDYAAEDDDPPEPPERALGPRVVLEPPVPGGSHSLEADDPVDPAEELARIRAAMQQQADRRATGGGAALPPTANLPTAPEMGPGEWVPLRSAWQPSAQTWKPLAERWEQNSRPEDAAPSGPPLPQVPAPVFPSRSPAAGPVVVTTQTASAYEMPVIPPPPRVAAPQPEAAPAAQTPATVEAQEPTPWPLLPLVWFNAAFDVVLLPWCPKGRLLRGPGGRKLLGVAGLACLAAAAALAAADRYGWPW